MNREEFIEGVRKICEENGFIFDCEDESLIDSDRAVELLFMTYISVRGHFISRDHIVFCCDPNDVTIHDLGHIFDDRGWLMFDKYDFNGAYNFLKNNINDFSKLLFKSSYQQ